MPNWMENYAGAMTTFVTLTPEEITAIRETLPCDVSLGTDATKPTQTGIREIEVEPQHEALENQERNMANDHMLRDRNVVTLPTTVISESLDATAEGLLLSTFDQPINADLEGLLQVCEECRPSHNDAESTLSEKNLVASINGLPSFDGQQQRFSVPQLESKASCELLVHTLPRDTAPEGFPDHVLILVEAACPPDNARATPSSPSLSCRDIPGPALTLTEASCPPDNAQSNLFIPLLRVAIFQTTS